MAPRARRQVPVRTQRLGVDYSRFSDEKQESITEQQGINREIAVDAEVNLVRSFADPDVSRDLSDRPGLTEMVEYLEAHPEVGFIVVNELDRLTAGVSQRSQIVALCQRLRVTILTEDIGAIDPFDDDKMHEADQRAVAAKGEVLKVRRRVRRNLRQKVIAGTVAMRPAFGTRMKPLTLPDGTELPSGARYVDSSGRIVRSGILEVHPTELPWLVKMFEWADEGASSESIARRLTAEQVKTKSGKDAWSPNSVRGILSNPLYKGEMTWGLQATKRYGDGRTYLEVRPEGDPGRVSKPSPLGALIDPELWERVNKPRRKRSTNRRTYGPQLLDNLVYCGRCGHKMYGRNDNAGAKNAHRNNINWRYFCYSGRPGYQPLEGYGGVCTKIHSMSEKQILWALAELSGPNSRATVLAEPDADVEQQRLNIEKQLEQLRQEFERGSRLAIKGSVAESVWDEMRAEIETRRELLSSQLASLGTDAAPVQATTALASSFGDLLPLLTDKSLPVAARRQALDAANLVTRIYADNPSVSVVLGPGLLSGLHGA